MPKDYREQEPRSPMFFQSDLSDALESANYHALEHAGKDNETYSRFLREMSRQLLEFANNPE